MQIKDGDWILYEADAASGRSVWYLPDGDGKGNTIWRTSYPPESIVAENEKVRNEASRAWAGDYHRVASIPLNLVYDKDIGLNDAFCQGDWKHVSRFLNDGDNRALRTKEGRV